MFDWWKQRRELAKIDRWEREEREEHKKKVADAKKEGKTPPDEGQLASLIWMYDEERSSLITRQLVREAHKYYLPTPRHDDPGWEEGSSTGKRYLTPEAASVLRAAIRKERNERWELWLKIITASTGVIGALIGLVAVLTK